MKITYIILLICKEIICDNSGDDMYDYIANGNIDYLKTIDNDIINLVNKNCSFREIKTTLAKENEVLMLKCPQLDNYILPWKYMNRSEYTVTWKNISNSTEYNNTRIENNMLMFFPFYNLQAGSKYLCTVSTNKSCDQSVVIVKKSFYSNNCMLSEAKENDNFEIYCGILHAKYNTIKWFKEEKEITNNYKYYTKLGGYVKGINNVTYSDSGKYVCEGYYIDVLKNITYTAKRCVNLTVIPNTYYDFFIVDIPNVTYAKNNKKLEVNCTSFVDINSYDYILTSWLYNGLYLPLGVRIYQLYSTDIFFENFIYRTSTLVFENVDISDDNKTFECEALSVTLKKIKYTTIKVEK
ncbi:type-I IFN receptor [Tanapox virus]|uniref:Type-I IFN receptor n=1 Tax=Tanapox virus TaxID=99000 RepID=A7XCS4_9POXV|nr:type-I IFN receptor [Tanapox virus]ABQ43767.1 type-I IFN receptor [Tanapox virus]